MNYGVVLLGAPASGKGTWAKLASQSLMLKHLSTGNLLRQEIACGSNIGKTVAEQMAVGQLVPDEIVVELVNQAISKYPDFLLDGFPRNIRQAELLDNILMKYHKSLTHAIYINVDRDRLVDRVSKRLVCEACGATYNSESNRPKVDNICDVCGGTVSRRQDDDPAIYQSRLDVYLTKTKPLIDYYREAGILTEFDNNREYSKALEDEFLSLFEARR